MEKRKTPRIRFKGFSDDWEQRKLGNMGSTFSGLAGKSKEDFGHGSAQFVTYMNVFSQPVADFQMTEPIEIDNKQNKVQYGDILFTTSSETPDEVGMSSVWLGDSDNVYLNSFCFGYRPEIKLEPYFMAYMLRSYSVRKRLIVLAQGISRYNISKNRVMEIEVPIASLEEQKKIGAYFKQLDQLITLHQRKLEKLKIIKKCMLEKLFPKNGEKTPKIRFLGFTDDWEQRKLGELLENLYNGQTPSRFSDRFWNGNINWLTSGELNRGVINKTVEKITNEGKESAHLQVVPKGTFVMAITGLEAAGTRGNCAILNISSTLNQSCMALFPKDNKLDTTFLFQWYRLVGDSYGIQFTQGTKQQSYNANIIKKLEISLPAVEEQKRIGTYLQTLDRLITLHQSELKKSQKIKNSMLERMIV